MMKTGKPNASIRLTARFFCRPGAWVVLTFLGVLPIQANGQGTFELPPGYQLEAEVTYSTVGEKANKLDIYFDPRSSKPLPLVVWIHGGGWRGGDKRNMQYARHLLDDGYAVASINYRLSHEAVFPAQIIDCKAAVRWLRAQADRYNIDPDRFAAWGSSAGGHLAALLGAAGDMPAWERGDHLAHPSRVQAVVDWFGPTDFNRMNDTEGSIDHFAADSPESRLIGGPVPRHPEKVRAANPITYVTESAPPFQIYHGKDDLLVLPNQAQLLDAALREKGHTPDFALLDGLGHGGKKWIDYVDRVEVFLNEHLKKDPPK